MTPAVERLLDEVAALVVEHGLGDDALIDATPELVLQAVERRLAQATALICMYRRLQERGDG